MKTNLQNTAEQLDLVAERLIPAAGPWPAASAMGVGADLLPRLRASEAQRVEVALSMMGSLQDFRAKSGDEQDELLRSLESSEPAYFALLRQVLYFAYYAQPAVVALLRQMGYDIQETPQPNGYHMAPFDEERVPKNGPGVWIPTSVVRKRFVMES